MDNKKFLIVLTISTLCFTIACQARMRKEYPEVFAHRGCWIKDYVPENSLDGIEMAVRYGFKTTECDVHWTRDSVLVCMHDNTINRTMRNAADYSPVSGNVFVGETDFAELRKNYVLASKDPSMRKPIPTFEEMLLKFKECGIKPILHCNIYEGYVLAQKILGDDGFIIFNSSLDLSIRARAISPESLVLYDAHNADITPGELLGQLDRIGGRCGTSSMKHDVCRKEMCDALRANGHEIQSSIFVTPHEMEAIHNGCSIILSDFCWFQTAGRKPFKKLKASGSKVAGEYSWDRIEHGGIIVRIKCKGDVEFTVNGDRTYKVSHGADSDTEMVGIRFYDTVPSLSIRKGTGAVIDKLEVEIYRI